jgi:membrane-associated protease RseP (regulator of RpoE activity)
MILRYCMMRSVWLAVASVAVLAIDASRLVADEYPVLAEWTQGKRVEVEEEPAQTFVDWEGLTLLVSGEAELGSGYWIGIYPRILNEDEEAKTGEREPRGVVVNRVLPASPAAQAKLSEGDIIVGAGEREINFLDELSEIVQNSAGEPIKLSVLRDGERMQVEVTPAKHFHRPGMLFFGGQGKEPEHGDGGESREKLEAAQREREFRAATVRDPQEGRNPDDLSEATPFILKPRIPPAYRTVREGNKLRDLVERGGSSMPVEGLITDVFKGYLVEISIGSDDGLEVGNILHVHRAGQAYLGRVQVIETSPDRSAAKILRESNTAEIQKGDRVATNLKVSDSEGEGTKLIFGELEVDTEVLKEKLAERDKGNPRYWIGISLQTIDQELAKERKVEPGQGVLVNHVVPDSPAAKAKLMAGDIILAAGDQKLSETAQLAESVRGSEGKTIKLKVRRGEKTLDLEVTPAKQGERRKMLFWREKGEEKEEQEEKGERREKLEGMLRKIREQQIEQAGGRTGKQGLGLIQRPQFPMPGAAVVRPWTPGAPMPSGLPDDMQVTIQKRGNKPAKVTVKQGEKLWQTTEGELGMLPPQALGYVARMLGRPMMPGMGGFGMGGAGGFAVPGTPVPGQPQRFEIRLDEDGKAQVIQGQGILRAENQGSGDGIRIKIYEAGEGGEKMPEPEGGNVEWEELRRRWKELRRPDNQPQVTAEKDARDAEISELQELVQKLRRELEERNEDKPRLEKQEKKKERRVREKGE